MVNCHKLHRLLAFALSLCVITSCAWTPRQTRDNSGIKAIQKELADADRPKPSQPVLPPQQVDQALMPALSASGKKQGDDRFDISVDQADARSFFMGLVKGTDYNMVVHPDVTGKISLDLHNVSVKDVMQVANEVYGYPYKIRGNLIQVLPGGLRSEVFHIDYLNLKRRGISETQVTNGEVTSAGSSSTGSNTNSSSVNNNSTNNNRNNERLNIGAQIRTETDADFWKELQNTLKVLVGDAKGRAVVVTPQAGIVVVRGMPDEIDLVRDYLQRAELIMRRQVVLEAKILEVSLSDGYQTGINWNEITRIDGNPLTLGISGTAPSTPNGIGGTFSGAFDSADFSGVINLLQTQGSVQVLSSPRISTVNNQKAVIKVGKDEFFVTDISNTTTTTTGTTTNNPEVQLTPFFSGIALDVTPQISEKGDIILHIHPSISEVEDQTKSVQLGSQTVELPLALSTIRETDSVVYAHSGQVIVLGGLMQDKSNDINSGTPVLANVPILGHLFSQQRNQSVKSELVILLKPIIMGPDGLKGGTRAAQERFDQFRRVLDKSYQPQQGAGDASVPDEGGQAAKNQDRADQASGDGLNKLYH